MALPQSPESYEMLELCRSLASISLSEPLALKVAYERMVLGIEPDAILRTELKLLGKLKRGLLSVDEVQEFAYVWKHLCVPLSLNLDPPQPSNSSTYELYFLQKYMEERKQKPCSKEMLCKQREEQVVIIAEGKKTVEKRPQHLLSLEDVIFIQDPCMTFWLKKDYVFSCNV